MDITKRKQWTSGELLMCAVLELLIVHIAYHVDRQKSAPFLSTAAWAILFGVGFGLVLSSISNDHATDMGINPHILFSVLLPPIILESGFNSQHRRFFANFWDIFMLGVVGTVATACLIGALVYWLGQTALLSTSLSPAGAMLYGSLISAINPIATQLILRKSHVPLLIPELLFGEHSINNGISIVLYNLCEKHVQSGDTETSVWSGLVLFAELIGIGAGSLVLAVIFGHGSVYLLRRSRIMLQQHQVYESYTLLLVAYTSYMAGEFFNLSGHLAVFFSGAFIRHYHLNSISRASATTFKHLLSTFSFLAENFIFLYLGVSLFAYSDTFEWDWSFTLVTFAVCFAARALVVFPICSVANIWRAIPFKYMVVIWFSGLRGATAFTLSLNIKDIDRTNHAAIIRSSTIFTVLTTTILFTMATWPLVYLLRLTKARHEHRVEGHTGGTGESNEAAAWIRGVWDDFDECFGGSTDVA